MWHTIGTALLCTSTVPTLYGLASMRRSMSHALISLCLANALCAADELLTAFWIALPINGTLAVICAWLWYRNRRKRHVLRALGAKSKARIGAMARKVREAGQPHPAPRPVPA